MTSLLDEIKFEQHDGLVPAIVQNAVTKEVLMLGFMNREALEMTLDKRLVTFWTRSRRRLWTKGETSGNVLRLVSVRINCEDNSLLVLAEPVGATCHTGHPSCFYREATSADAPWTTISEPQFDPTEVYRK